MDVRDFDYELPPERIAQAPAGARDGSRLLRLPPAGGPAHHRFTDLPSLLRAGDLLIVNDTRVVPARLVGRKASGGRVELLLIERVEAGEGRELWRAWLKASRKPAADAALVFGHGLSGHIVEREGPSYLVRLECESGELGAALERAGRMPLPPYIKRPDASHEGEDRERYQTVFAARPGAIAAPTAGLHFSAELLARLDAAGIRRTTLTLHVGLGTFQPVEADRVEEHRLHEEAYALPAAAAAPVDETRREGGRVVAVGTTVARTLESCAAAGGRVVPGAGRTALFIYPGFRFRVVDAMITNFHLPRSTLLMLVAAFAGRERVLAAYREAIAAGYRFYSYGDAMLVEARG